MFEWDQKKSEAYKTERGFGFELIYDFDFHKAQTKIDDRVQYDEARYLAIMRSTVSMVLPMLSPLQLANLISGSFPCAGCTKRRPFVMASKPDPYKTDETNKPLSDEEVKQLRPGKQMFEELGMKAPRGRPAMQEQDRKKRVTIMLDQDLIERLKADGKGWQTRANEALRKALGL